MRQLFGLLAHEGEAHAEAGQGFLSWLLHRPTWIALLTVALVLLAVYFVTKLLKLSFVARLMAVVASIIILGILYLPHNPSVTGIILSAGFVVTFLLTFTLLGKKP